jgi:hypothetical protein
VIDPTSRRVPHLVIEADDNRCLARLVPVELADSGNDSSGGVRFRSTVEEVRELPPVHEVAYLRLDGFPDDDPDWDVGIAAVFALPYYPRTTSSRHRSTTSPRTTVSPKGEVEIRRACAVGSADGHELGHVGGFLTTATI